MNRAQNAVRGRFSHAGVALLWAASLLAIGVPAVARDYPAERQAVELDALPPEARQVLERIRAGGPFPFERDGVTFGNREATLPPHRRGYYHEYTVATPGVRTRGARRIVCGGPRRTPEVCYYSADHYASFRRIVE
jgi:ribonuclease T1